MWWAILDDTETSFHHDRCLSCAWLCKCNIYYLLWCLVHVYIYMYIYMWWSILDDTEKLFRHDRCLFYNGQGRQELLCHLALEFRCLRHMDRDWRRDRPILGEFGNIFMSLCHAFSMKIAGPWPQAGNRGGGGMANQAFVGTARLAIICIYFLLLRHAIELQNLHFSRACIVFTDTTLCWEKRSNSTPMGEIFLQQCVLCLIPQATDQRLYKWFIWSKDLVHVLSQSSKCIIRSNGELIFLIGVILCMSI